MVDFYVITCYALDGASDDGRFFASARREERGGGGGGAERARGPAARMGMQAGSSDSGYGGRKAWYISTS